MGFRLGLWVAGPFVRRCLTSPTVLRFHIPLIEPDSAYFPHPALGEGSRCRPRKAGGPLRKPDQAKLLVQGVVGIPRGSRARHFVFGAQPLAQPPAACVVPPPSTGINIANFKNVFHASCLFSNGYSASNPPYSGPAWTA